MPSTDQVSPSADPPAPPGAPARRVVVRVLPDYGELPPAPPVPAPRPPGPPPVAAQPDERVIEAVRDRARAVLRLALEVADGRRPVAQLAGLVQPSVLRYVAAAVGRLDRPAEPTRSRRAPVPRGNLTRPGGAPGLRSIRVCVPADGVAEVSAVWRYRGRARALAARFELFDAARPGGGATGVDARGLGRWVCTVLRLG